MQSKEKLLDYIQKATKVIEPLNLNKETKREQIAKLTKYANNIENLELIVPIIGIFSSGKSTLINHYLRNKKLLPTGTKPVTKLATELRYSPNEEYAELIKLDPNNVDHIIESKKISLGELVNCAAENGKEKSELEYSYIKLYVKNEKLKELEPFILTDMPGFNSRNNLHNQAIDLYIRRGVYFIVLQNIEEGEVNSKTLEELNKIIESEKEFSFWITKCEKRDADGTLEDVVKQMRETLFEVLGYQGDVYTASHLKPGALGDIISKINKDEIISNIFANELISLGYKTIDIFKANIDILKEDKTEISKAQERLSLQKTLLEEKQSKEMSELESRQFDGVNKISEQVKIALRSNKPRLIRMLENEQHHFSEEVGSLVQSTMSSSIKTYLENLSSELTEQFAGVLQDVVNKNQNQMGLASETLDRLKTDINRKINQTLLDIRNIDTNVESNNQDNEIFGAIFKMIMSFLTQNPIAKTIASFLPDIISNIFSSSSDSRAEQRILEMKRQDMLNKMFDESVIPQVISNVSLQLPKMLNEFKRDLMKNIKGIFDKEIQDKMKEIDRAILEKGNIKDKENEITLLDQAIKSLDTLITQDLKMKQN